MKQIIKAINVIKGVTDGMFMELSKTESEYIGTDEQLYKMIEQFDRVKHIILEHKEEVAQYLYEHDEYINDEKRYSFAQVVLILLGTEVQIAYDIKDEALYNQFIEEVAVWQEIIQYAKRLSGVSI